MVHYILGLFLTFNNECTEDEFAIKKTHLRSFASINGPLSQCFRVMKQGMYEPLHGQSRWPPNPVSVCEELINRRWWPLGVLCWGQCPDGPSNGCGLKEYQCVFLCLPSFQWANHSSPSTFRGQGSNRNTSVQSLVSKFNGGTCLNVFWITGESMWFWWGTGDPDLGDITRDEASVSEGKLTAEPLMPGYITGMPPGYQHFSSMGR